MRTLETRYALALFELIRDEEGCKQPLPFCRKSLLCGRP